MWWHGVVCVLPQESGPIGVQSVERLQLSDPRSKRELGRMDTHVTGSQTDHVLR